MAVNVKMGVDIGSFTSGIKQGQQILKGLNAEMKASEAEFKATGNAEQKLNSQTKTLNSQLNVQKGIADQARQALKTMTDQGIDPADAAYQKMYVTLMNAEAGANDALAALNALKNGSEGAADGAEKLSDSLGDIKNKMSLEQVRSGIDTITKGLESAAQKAIQLGESIWNAVMDKAQWADDTATMAQMYGIDLDTFLRMQALVETGLDTSVEAILKSQKKLRKGIGEENKKTMEALFELNLAFETTKGGMTQLISDDEVQLFWMAGQALMNMSDAYDKEAAAQSMFGRSWEELVPLFTKYKSFEEYQKALEGVQVASEDDVNALAELNDKVLELKQKLNTLSTDILATLAPALTDAADALSGLLSNILDYLETDEGKKALEDLSKAVSGLFDDLGKIDPQDVVSGFTEVFNTVVGGVQWLTDHWSEVVAAMESIVGGWALLKVTGGVLDVVKIVTGLTSLTATKTAAAAAGKAAGASWGAAFATAVMNASPFLVFLYTLLNPAGSAGNNYDVLYDENGNLTEAGKEAGLTLTEEESKQAEETRRENQKRVDEIRKRNEMKIESDRVGQNILEEERKSVEIDKQRVEEIRKRNEKKMTWNPLISMGGIEDQLPEEGQYWLRGLYAPWSQVNDKEFNMTDLLLGWNGIGKLWNKLTGGDDKKMEIPAEVNVPQDEGKKVAEDVGTVQIPAELTFGGGGGGYIDIMSKWFGRGFANGLPNVPNDGLYRLHRGERVMTAREVQSRSYNSNLYVESMYMNGGTDAAGLAAAMAAAQRRQMSGYGS